MHHMFMIMTLEASQRLLFEWIEWYIIDHAYQSVVYIWKEKTKQNKNPSVSRHCEPRLITSI